MLTKHIQSLQHKLVKEAVQIRKNRRARREKNQALVVGEKMVKEISKHFLPKALFSLEPQTLKAENSYTVSKEVLKKITGVPAPDKMAALFPLPNHSLGKKDHLLILDEIEDPGNLGTLFRTSLGLKWDGIFLTPKTTDPFSEKALRASKGSVFFQPYAYMEKDALKNLLEKSSYEVFLADIHGKDPEKLVKKKKTALILSAESKGVSEEFIPISQKISLPMDSSIESYNVASAGSILLYLLRER